MYTVGNKIEVVNSDDTDLMGWCEENCRYVDEIDAVNEESELLWTKNIPYAISFNDVCIYNDEDYIYWGYDAIQ